MVPFQGWIDGVFILWMGCTHPFDLMPFQGWMSVSDFLMNTYQTSSGESEALSALDVSF
jgi:hypothetical protein